MKRFIVAFIAAYILSFSGDGCLTVCFSRMFTRKRKIFGDRKAKR